MRLKVKRSSPVLDDAEIEAGELSVDEGLEDTDGPASIVLTVGISHLHTRTHARCWLPRYTHSGKGLVTPMEDVSPP